MCLFGVVGGTVPSSLWPRGKTASPRRRPASSGLRNKRLQTEAFVGSKICSNKSIEKESNPLVYFVMVHYIYIIRSARSLLITY